MKRWNNRNFRMMVMPLNYYLKKFHFEPDILKKTILTYTYQDIYPTMYHNDNYGISSRILSPNQTFDRNGVPLTNNTCKKCYNPVMVAQHGLLNYGFYKANQNISYYKKTISAGNWLRENCHSGLIQYQSDYQMQLPRVLIKKPFISAMSQGQALSLWSRIYVLTEEKKWLDPFESVVNRIVSAVENGGTSIIFEGHIWYEEYPSIPGTHVLNGFMFCLIGLYDAYSITQSENIGRAFFTGIKSLQAKLPLFDNGYLSIYHLGHIEYPGNEVCISPSYHIIHVKLLETLFAITKCELFRYYAEKWK